MQPHIYVMKNGASNGAGGQPVPYAVRTPRLLVLLMFSRCNNRCRFCMVQDEIENSRDMMRDEARRLILKQKMGSRVEFFGGEPLIYPYFLELLELAVRQGHSCSIATNARGFASERFTGKVARLNPSRIYVRTSLYGPDARIHDYYTRRAGSFDQTLKGIVNLVRGGFTTQVNIILMRRNAGRLLEMLDLVAGTGVPRIKFSMLIDSERNREHTVRIAEVRGLLEEGGRYALERNMKLTIEKTPMCAAPQHVASFACERVIAPDGRVYDREGACGECLVAGWCPGLDPGYTELYGTTELEPLTAIPADQLARLTPEKFASFESPVFQTTFLTFRKEWMEDERTLRKLVRLDKNIRQNLGQLALVPEDRIIEERR